MSRNGLPNSNPHFPDTPLGSFFVDYLRDTNMHAFLLYSLMKKLHFPSGSYKIDRALRKNYLGQTASYLMGRR